MERYELEKAVQQLEKDILSACEKVELNKVTSRIVELEEVMQSPTFWNDQEKAQEVLQEVKVQKNIADTWKTLRDQAEFLKEFLHSGGDDELGQVEEEYLKSQKQYDDASLVLYFHGPYDKEPVLFSVIAGVGGDDAEDFGGMLLRMFISYFERKGFTYEVLEYSEGAGDGVKKATLEVQGSYAYGMLKGERGVHRLVRLSPYKSGDSRQTSFALIEVLPLPKQVSKDDIVIEEKDLRVDTFRASGAGGQKVNKTDSAVRITHIPTGIAVACQVERSQQQNRQRAMDILRARLFQLKQDSFHKEQSAIKGEVVTVDWGKQIRSYVLHPYKMVKDHRTGVETSQVEKVLDGDLDAFIDVEVKQGV